jgi:hypothetical protein
MLMNLFRSTAAPSKTIKIGGSLSGKKLIIDENFITYSATDGRFKVKKSSIDTVSIDAVKKGILKAGMGMVQLIGKGTILASVSLPLGWAEKMQEAILNEIEV